MNSKIVRIIMAVALALPLAALAQTDNAAAGNAPASAAAPATTAPGPTKLGVISVQDCILATNEGQKEFEALGKKFEPTRNELKSLNDEIDQGTGLVNNCGSPTTSRLDLNSSGKGKFPFSFTWTSKSQLLLTEVFGTATSFSGGAVSSYTVNRNGSLTPISDSVGDNQTAPCWIVTTGSHAYAANYFGGYVSSFTVGSKGDLTHATDTAAVDNPGTFTTLDDMAITSDGRTIYQLVPGLGQVRPFQVDQSTGALTRLAVISDGLAGGSGAAGIAAINFT